MKKKMIIAVSILLFLSLISSSRVQAMDRPLPPPEATFVGAYIKKREEEGRIRYLYTQPPQICIRLPDGPYSYGGVDFLARASGRKGQEKQSRFSLPLDHFHRDREGGWTYLLDTGNLDWEGKSWTFSFRAFSKEERPSPWKKMEGFLDLDQEEGRVDLTFDPLPLGRDRGIWVFDRPFWIRLNVMDDQPAYIDDYFYLEKGGPEGKRRERIPLQKSGKEVQAKIRVQQEGRYTLYFFIKDGAGRPIPDPETGDNVIKISYLLDLNRGKTKAKIHQAPGEEEEGTDREGGFEQEGEEGSDKKTLTGSSKDKGGEQAPTVQIDHLEKGKDVKVEYGKGLRKLLAESPVSFHDLTEDPLVTLSSEEALLTSNLRLYGVLNGQPLDLHPLLKKDPSLSDKKVKITLPKESFSSSGYYTLQLVREKGEEEISTNLFSFEVDSQPPRIIPVKGLERKFCWGNRLEIQVDIRDQGGLSEIQRIVDGKVTVVEPNGQVNYSDRFTLGGRKEAYHIAYRVKDRAGNVTDTRSSAYPGRRFFTEAVEVSRSPIRAMARLSPLFWLFFLMIIVGVIVYFFLRSCHLHKFNA